MCNTGAVIIHAGTNNLSDGDSPDEVVQQSKDIADTIKQINSDCHIIISSILPRKSNKLANTVIAETNQSLKQMCNNSSLVFLENTGNFTNDSEICAALYKDNIHLNAKGGKVFGESICEKIRDILDLPANQTQVSDFQEQSFRTGRNTGRRTFGNMSSNHRKNNSNNKANHTTNNAINRDNNNGQNRRNNQQNSHNNNRDNNNYQNSHNNNDKDNNNSQNRHNNYQNSHNNNKPSQTTIDEQPVTDDVHANAILSASMDQSQPNNYQSVNIMPNQTLNTPSQHKDAWFISKGLHICHLNVHH